MGERNEEIDTSHLNSPGYLTYALKTVATLSLLPGALLGREAVLFAEIPITKRKVESFLNSYCLSSPAGHAFTFSYER